MKKVMTDMHCYQITSVYGLTEASPGITQTAIYPVELRAETVGKSFPGVEVRVIDPSTKSKLRWCTPLQATGYVHTSALDIVFY